MEMNPIRNIGVGVLLLCVCAAHHSLAAVIDLREQVRQHPSLIHHYTFHNDVLRDSKGELHLAAWRSNSPSAVLYGAGADALSWAGTAIENPTNASAYVGAAWYTTNTVALPRSLTVECVLRPNKLPWDNGYRFSARGCDRF